MFLAQCLEKCVCQCICLRCVCVEQRVYSLSYLRGGGRQHLIPGLEGCY